MLTNFAGDNFSVGELTTVRTSWTRSRDAGIPGRHLSTWDFVLPSSATSLISYNDNDFVNGWVMVTNQ